MRKDLGEEIVEVAGDGLLLRAGLLEQGVDRAWLGRRAEQALAVEQEPEAPEGLRVGEVRKVERMRVDLAATLAVEADGGEVGEDHPAAVVEFGQIAEGLLDGGEIAVAALLGIQIRAGGLEFDDDAGDVLFGAEEAETGVRGAGASGLGGGGFGFEMIGVEVPDGGSEAEQTGEDIGQELPLKGFLVQAQERGIGRRAGPLVREGGELGRQVRGEADQATRQKVGAEQGFEKVWHRFAGLGSAVSRMIVSTPPGVGASLAAPWGELPGSKSVPI